MKTGIYRMPASDYFGLDAINKSGLDEMARSPLHYWQRYRNPMRAPREETPAMAFGTAIHAAALEAETFRQRFTALPPDLDRRTKEGKEAYARAEATGKRIITHDQDLACAAIAARLRSSPAAVELFAKGNAELTIIWSDPTHGVLCKARPDWISASGILVDLKSSEDARATEFARSSWDYGYHRQAAWYLDGYRAATGKDALGFVFAVFEKSAPFACAYYIADDAMITKGREENAKLLARYAECLKANAWPGYPETIEALSLPAWATKEKRAATDPLTVTTTTVKELY